MICNCNNFLARDIGMYGDYLLIKTDKLFAVHRAEIKKMSTRRSPCQHRCENQYLYIDTSNGEIGVFMKNKTYEELLLYILVLLYKKDECDTKIFENRFDVRDYKGYFENE